MSDLTEIKNLLNHQSKVIKHQQERIDLLEKTMGILLDDPEHTPDMIKLRIQKREAFSTGLFEGFFNK